MFCSSIRQWEFPPHSVIPSNVAFKHQTFVYETDFKVGDS